MTLTRRTFLLGLAAPLAVRAQQGQRTFRLGILSSGTGTVRGHLERELLDSLREQGYVEGVNLRIERRYSGAGGPARTQEAAGELAAMNLDAVVTTCTPSTGMAKRAMQSTPIVMAAVSDPVGAGLIESLARPGGNITGRSSQGEEILPKMMGLFSRLLPRGATVAVLGMRRNPVHPSMWETLNDSASVRTLGLKLVRVEFVGSADLPKAFEEAVQARANGIFVLGDEPFILNQQALLVRLAAERRLPDCYWAREFVDAGGLMSYGESLRDGYRGVGTYVVRVARGARPADLPVQQPTKFELVLNRRRAKALGISIPQDLALLANEVLD